MSITLDTLKEAVQLKEQIAELEHRLARLLDGSAPGPKSAGRKRGGMSEAGRARIAAAARARWAKVKGNKAAEAPAKKKKKGGITAAGRARLAAAMRARWAARKKGAPAPNASKK
jgi:hypothetical protein